MRMMRTAMRRAKPAAATAIIQTGMDLPKILTLARFWVACGAGADVDEDAETKLDEEVVTVSVEEGV